MDKNNLQLLLLNIILMAPGCKCTKIRQQLSDLENDAAKHVKSITLKRENQKPGCTFPSYLTLPFPNGKERYWLTETQYLNTSPEWEKQLLIYVRPHEIVAMVQQDALCTQGGRSVTCSHKEVKYKLKCEEKQKGENFIVLKTNHQNGGTADYRCYSFKQRNANVIQIHKSAKSDKTDYICSSFTMMRDQWIWTTPKQEEWTLCPPSLQGGYNFRTYTMYQGGEYVTEEKYCEHVWRPSRLESECVKGEGILLLYPDPSCSPFFQRQQEVQLYCWAWWEEGRNSFVVLSQANKIPQFVLRYSSFTEADHEFVSYLYFSPIVPANSQGMPHDGFTSSLGMVKMRIQKSDAGEGVCYDEDTRCTDYAKEGRCTNKALYQYANYCQKSCGLCDLLPSTREECFFPGELQKKWFYFLKNQTEILDVNKGTLTFSSLGSYVCKGINPSSNFMRYYKMMSYYNNGCRPRYTCMELGSYADDLLQIRISKSHLTDESFDLCKFENDPLPIGDAIRSNEMKTLLPEPMASFNSCKLERSVQVSIADDKRSCHGTLSDWNRNECRADNQLVLELHGDCDSERGHHTLIRQFTCIAAVSVLDGYILLYTTEISNSNQFTCWVVETFAERMSYRPWNLVTQLNHTDCASSYIYNLRKKLVSLSVVEEKWEPYCEKTLSDSALSQPRERSENGEHYLISSVIEKSSTATSCKYSHIVLCASCCIHCLILTCILKSLFR